MQRVFKKGYRKRIATVIILSFVVIVCLMIYAVQTMKADYFDAIGRRAMTFSMVMTEQLNLSDDDVDTLKTLSFDALLQSEINTSFEAYVRRFMKPSEIKYVYLLHHLLPEERLYQVQADEEDYYGLKSGTALNTIYLIDAVIDDATRLEDTEGQGYTDKDRYTYLHEDIQAIYDKEMADFKFYTDEWGTYITGFAPLYTTKGQYIGMLCSDVFVDEYEHLIKKRIAVLGLMATVVLVMISVVVLGFNRIQKIEKIVEDLKTRAYLDDMTGFYNRRTLNEQGGEYSHVVIKHNESIAVTMIDIDNFKFYNDSYGHPKGDEIIKAVAGVIQEELEEGQYPFRYGGDEFLILSVDKTTDYIYGNAMRIKKKINSLQFEVVEKALTLSVGIAHTKPKRHFNIYKLISKADEMLYEAKNKGRDRICMADEVQQLHTHDTEK